MTLELRTEIVESQKVRSDLMKWKLIAVGALGAVGFGIGGTSQQFSLALCLIPFVSVYVDMLCYHLNIRILVIGAFLKADSDTPDVLKRYEKFCENNRAIFTLENWALSMATIFVSIGIILTGFLSFILRVSGRQRKPPTRRPSPTPTNRTRRDGRGGQQHHVGRRLAQKPRGTGATPHCWQ